MITLENIDHGRGFDWSRASEDYARYRDIYPQSFYQNIQKLGLCLPQKRVLDLGTGTGVLPRALHKTGARFVGADIAPGQIEAAKRLSRDAGMEDIEYVVGAAEELSFADASFDTALAAMSFHYMNPETALPAIHRMLAPGGRFAILSMLWLPEEDALTRGTERLILKHNPSWTGGGYVRKAPPAPDWAGPLFAPDCTFGYVEDIPFTREGWQGRVRASRGVGAALDGGALCAFEAEHAEFLAGFDAPLQIPHYITIEVFRRVQE